MPLLLLSKSKPSVAGSIWRFLYWYSEIDCTRTVLKQALYRLLHFFVSLYFWSLYLEDNGGACGGKWKQNPNKPNT